ncbi:MAG TPA: hypothetical protein VNA88_05500 [Candidatus Kapabacteria bacterium]|jgi:uncharacterized membrane protein YeaQ/YmgE (transglycosylase-associated protein family)|nr:hypothetical protein [Candidatus Kapabacteria bacterium]
MSILQLLLLLAIAALCGGLGQALVGYSVGGCLVSIVVGLIGAYLGMWVATEAGLPELLTVNIGGQPFPIIWSIIGSALFAAVLGLINRAIAGRRYRV